MTDSTEGGTPDSGAIEVGPDAFTLPSTYHISFNANGADDVVLRLAPYSDAAGVHRQIWGINGFQLEAVTSDQAYGPTPISGATDVEKSVVLSWNPADGTAATNGHRLFLSDDFADVDDGFAGAEIGVLSDTVFDTAGLPFALEYGTTYYWRVDQASTPGGPWTDGAVWSFTVEPVSFAIPAGSIEAEASTVYAGTDPNSTFNGSGLDDDDLHSTADASMWLSTKDDSGAWIQYEFDKEYKLHQMLVWNYNSVAESAVGWGIKEAKIEYSTNGTGWTTLGTTHEFTQAPGTPGYGYNTAVDLSGVVAKYIRITANNNWGDNLLIQYGLSEVRFMYVPVWARLPEPDDGQTDVGVDNVTLSWRPGREAASSDLYFSANKKAVINETVDIYSIPLGEGFDTGELDLGETYYWKVNSVNAADPTIWAGDLWSFATQEYLVVDDIEDYNNFLPDRVWETWIDGWGNAANGSQIGHLPTQAEIDAGATFTERGITHGGNQSMPLYYDNTVASYSEATANIADLPIGPDWTTNGIKVLSMWFYCDPNNTATEQMYVKLNGVRVNYSGDPYDLTRPTWKQWNVDLRDFGVDLTNVTTISIGFERLGGSSSPGRVYFDDIALYPGMCIPSLVKPDADLNRDCVVNALDVEQMASQWLVSGLLVTPQQPANTGLVAHWEFEGNVNDSAGANDATTTGGPTYAAGKVGQAIEFDGLNDYALVQGSFDLPVYSVGLWFRVRGGSGARDLFSLHNDAGVHGLLIEIPANGTLRFLHRAPIGASTGSDIRTTTTYDDGSWHHAAVVKSSDTISAYVNGEMVGDGADDTAFGEALQNVAFSLLKVTDLTNDTRYFPGSIDDVRIYSRTLSAGEVAGLAGKTEAFSAPADLDADGVIDFNDFAVLGESWLDEQLWPQP